MDEENGEMELTPVTNAPLQSFGGSDIEVQIDTAKKYPREISLVREKVLALATVSQNIAGQCWYALPRGGKNIEGPSVRLAEIIAVAYTNIRAGKRVSGTDNKFIYAQGFAADLECNTAISMETMRRITNKNGERYADDLIMLTGNAAASIAFRNALFTVVPLSLFENEIRIIRQVGRGEGKTMEARLSEMFEAYKRLGVSPDSIYALMEVRKSGDITMEHYDKLKGIYTAIHEGTTSVEEVFGPCPNAKTFRTGSVKVGGDKPSEPTPPEADSATETPLKSPQIDEVVLPDQSEPETPQNDVEPPAQEPAESVENWKDLRAEIKQLAENFQPDEANNLAVKIGEKYSLSPACFKWKNIAALTELRDAMKGATCVEDDPLLDLPTEKPKLLASGFGPSSKKLAKEIVGLGAKTDYKTYKDLSDKFHDEFKIDTYDLEKWPRPALEELRKELLAVLGLDKAGPSGGNDIPF